MTQPPPRQARKPRPTPTRRANATPTKPPREPRTTEPALIAGRDMVDVSIERLIPGGFGIGFVEGRTVLVPLSAPGDRLRVHLRGRRGGALVGAIDEVLEASPIRVEPPCPHFGTCGGCDFQHLAYEHQLASKVEFIRDCFRRIGGIEIAGEIPIVEAPDPWAYRGVAEWQVDPASGQVGYFRRESRDIEDVALCPILDGSLNAAMAGVRRRIGEHPEEQRHEVRAVAGDDWAVVHREGDAAAPPTVSHTVGEETFQLDPRVFFQANAALLAELTAEVVGSLAPKGSRFKPGTAVDLFCGVGLFTIPLARRFNRVIGVESDPIAVHYAQTNARAAGVTNVRIRRATVETWLPPNVHHLGPVDAVILDPPRIGAAEAVPALVKMAAPRMTYVSCDPATLARDVKNLVQGGYSLSRLTAFDMFPQTHHVEVVAHLEFAGVPEEF